jgi:thiamine biosynthesis lipoprotein
MRVPCRRSNESRRGVLAGTVTLVVAVAALTAGCGRRQAVATRKQTRLLMDTYVTLTAVGPAAKADKAIADAFRRMEEVERKFNHLDTASPFYAFNSRNEPLTDTEAVRIVEAAVAMSELSGGVFDVTVEPLVRLWGFYGDGQAVPPQRAIDSCLAFVGYENLVLEPGRVTKRDPRTTVDLGGIAKGHALAEAARVLRAGGVDSAIVDAGGDVYAIGRKGGENWRIGVRNPRGDGIIGVVAASNLAVVTSGDYERYFLGPDGVRYCHIINPRMGWPARGFASSTVLMRDPLLAQGLSKVLFILGPDAFALATRTEHFEGLLITDSLKAVMSDGLAAVMKVELPAADSAR